MVGDRALAAFLMQTPRRYLVSHNGSGALPSTRAPGRLQEATHLIEETGGGDLSYTGMDAPLRAPFSFVRHKSAANQQQAVRPISMQGAYACANRLYTAILH
jgi:hypothetical protein